MTAFAFAENLCRAYRADGYNTVVINDIVGNDGGVWTRRTEASIIAALELYRRLNMNVVVAATFAGFPGEGIASATDEVITERIGLYSAHDRGEILGFYCGLDDEFLSQNTVSEQKRWYDGIKAVNASFSVFGIFGLEFSTFQTEQNFTDYFSPATFDHLIMLTYPYNLTNNPTYGPQITAAVNAFDSTFVDAPLDATSTTAATRVTQFLLNAWEMAENDNFLNRLYADQLILPLIETFEYIGAPASQVPTGEDVATMASVHMSEIQRIKDDTSLASILYFHWGVEADNPSGMGSVNGRKWWVGARESNKAAKTITQNTLDKLSSCRMAQITLNIR